MIEALTFDKGLSYIAIELIKQIMNHEGLQNWLGDRKASSTWDGGRNVCLEKRKWRKVCKIVSILGIIKLKVYIWCLFKCGSDWRLGL